MFISSFFYSANIEVQMLDNSKNVLTEITKRFQLAPEVAKLEQNRLNKLKRVKYGSFIAQRRPVPSKQFVVRVGK
jgi:hypothetical protein